MKYLYRLLNKRNRGFTLVEMVISTALLSILIIGVLSFATPIFNMLRVEQKSARATSLAETIDSYVLGLLRKANKVVILENTSFDALKSGSLVSQLKPIQEYMRNSPPADTGGSSKEVRCLGICWMVDQSSPNYTPGDANSPRKLMLVDIKLNRSDEIIPTDTPPSDYLTPVASQIEPKTDGTLEAGLNKVFDDNMYFGLYPKITLETFLQKNSDGTEKSDNANGYKITAEINGDSECYNTLNEATRQKSHLLFTGISYIELANYKLQDESGKINVIPANEPVKIDPDDNHAIESGAKKYTDTNGKSYFCPDTFIVYVVNKNYNAN